jgi:hypothetical protein
MPETLSAHKDARRSAASAGVSMGLSDYLWRPWYAKLWWLAAAIFWIIAAVASWVFPSLSSLPPESVTNFLALALHPFAIVPVLGFPAVWAWRCKTVLPWDPGFEAEFFEDDDEELYGGESMGFERRISFMSDPRDPRSPMNPSHPLNPDHHGIR